MKTGIARATASVQYFLDTCDAVRSWKEKDGYFIFRFDPRVEVTYAPADVWFNPDEAPEDAREVIEKADV